MRRLGRLIVYLLLTCLPFHYLLVQKYPGARYWKEFLAGVLAYQILVTLVAYRGSPLGERSLKRLGGNRIFWLFVGWTVFAGALHPSIVSLKGIAGYTLYSVIALGIMVNFDLRHSRSLLRLICFVGSVVAATSLYQFFFDPSLGGLLRSPHWIPGFELVRVRAGSAMGASPIVTGAYLALIVPLGLALFTCEPSRLARWFRALQVGLMVVALAVTFSRSAWVQLAVSFALLAALLVLPEKWQAARIRIAGLVCLTVALAAMGFVVYTGSMESPSHLWLVAGNQVRVQRWYTSLSASDVEQLLVGYGPGVTWPMFASGQAEFGMVLRRLEQLTPGVSSTESFALMLFLDLGILGLLTFFAQLWVWIRGMLGVQPGAYGRGKTWPLSWALTSALAGAMVSALVSITLASWQVAALMWTYAGLSSIYAGPRDQSFTGAPHSCS